MSAAPSPGSSSSSVAQRFKMRVGLGKKKPQRQSSLRRSLKSPPHSPPADSAEHTSKPVDPVDRKTAPGSRADLTPGGSASQAATLSAAADRDGVNVQRSSTKQSLLSGSRPDTTKPHQNDLPPGVRSARPVQRANVANAPVLAAKKSQGFLGTLGRKLRARSPGSEVPRAQSSAAAGGDPRTSAGVSRQASRSRPPPPSLPNSFTSKSRRDDALRARGLLPARNLSDIEAEEDRRLGAVQESEASGSGSEDGRTQAKEIVEMWRSLHSGTVVAAGPSTSLSVEESKVDTAKDARPDSSLIVPLTSSSASNKGAKLSTPTPALGLDAPPATPPKTPSRRVSGPADFRSSPSATARPRGPRTSRSSFDNAFVLPRTSPPTCPGTEKASERLERSPASSSHGAAQPPQLSPSRQSFSSQKSARASDGTATRTAPQLPTPPRSPRSVHSGHSARPAPTGALPTVPAELATSGATASPAIASPTRPAFPLHFQPSQTSTSTSSHNTLLMPASPTLPSLVGSSSSQLSQSTLSSSAHDHPPTLDRALSKPVPASKKARTPPSPIIVESIEEHILRSESIIEVDAALIDEFGAFGEPPLSAPIPRARIADARAPQRKSLGFFGKKRPGTLPLGEAVQELAKPVSMSNLRRAVMGAQRPRPQTIVGPAVPRAPLSPTMHSRGSILLSAANIDDDESRRLSEMAFLT